MPRKTKNEYNTELILETNKQRIKLNSMALKTINSERSLNTDELLQQSKKMDSLLTDYYEA